MNIDIVQISHKEKKSIYL